MKTPVLTLLLTMWMVLASIAHGDSLTYKSDHLNISLDGKQNAKGFAWPRTLLRFDIDVKTKGRTGWGSGSLRALDRPQSPPSAQYGDDGRKAS